MKLPRRALTGPLLSLLTSSARLVRVVTRGLEVRTQAVVRPEHLHDYVLSEQADSATPVHVILRVGEAELHPLIKVAGVEHNVKLCAVLDALAYTQGRGDTTLHVAQSTKGCTGHLYPRWLRGGPERNFM